MQVIYAKRYMMGPEDYVRLAIKNEYIEIYRSKDTNNDIIMTPLKLEGNTFVPITEDSIILQFENKNEEKTK